MASLWLVASFSDSRHSVGRAVEYVRIRRTPASRICSRDSILNAGHSFNMQLSSPAASPFWLPPTDSPPAVCVTRSSAWTFIANLPPELDGLRIAQLSDIHIGDYMPPAEIARAVGMANISIPTWPSLPEISQAAWRSRKPASPN
jgi:hypothetical protein